jgi:hypothetical protein
MTRNITHVRWTLALPGWAWVILILFTYVVIKAPADALLVLGAVGHLISGLGNGIITVISSFKP